MRKVLSGNRPDITPAQLVAGVPVIANLLAAFHLFTVTQAQQDALTASIAWAGALVLGDAALRIGRAHADAKVNAAALTPAALPASTSPGGPDGAHAVEVPLTPEEIAAALAVVGANPSETTPSLPSDEEELAAPPPPA